MRRSIATLIALAISASLTLFAPGSARADDVAVSATVLDGTRTITLATLTALGDVFRAASVTGSLAVTVTETAVNGVNPWSVTVDLCGTNGSGTKDCAKKSLTLGGDATKAIGGANVTIKDRAVTPTVLPVEGSSTATSGVEALTTARTIWTTTGQATATLYTGTYVSTSTITLTPPTDAVPGAYEGLVVVTLVT